MRGFAIRSRRISRPHALLERRLDSVWLTDMRSKNGTYVNGDRLFSGERRLLAEGDRIRFSKGMSHLTVVGAKSPSSFSVESIDYVLHLEEQKSAPRDVFGFESNVLEFTKLGASEESATTLAKRFQPLQVISSGGMGRVILAQDVHSGRFVALKIMLRELLKNEHYVQQFVREAVITARLQHPHIIPVYDLGFFTDSQLYYSMRFIEGQQFDERMVRVGLPERVRILRCVARAAKYAHSVGLWHRDLKPQNILIGEIGDTYVIDWGLVSVQRGKEYRVRLPKLSLDRQAIVLPDSLIKQTDQALTAAPGFMGPPAYMAPEQLVQDEERMGAVSDIWAIGVMLFECLTGQHPLEDYKCLPSQLMPSVLAEPLPAAADVNPNAPRELSALCQRMLVKNPEDRMQNLSEFIDVVGGFLRKNAKSSISRRAARKAQSSRSRSGTVRKNDEPRTSLAQQPVQTQLSHAEATICPDVTGAIAPTAPELDLQNVK
jgi:serine/threonine-protein kinase